MINGNNITTGTLDADLIRSGNIQPGSGQTLRIAGFDVSATTLSGTNITIQSADGRIEFGSYGSIYPTGDLNAIIIGGTQALILNAPAINIGTGSSSIYINGSPFCHPYRSFRLGGGIRNMGKHTEFGRAVKFNGDLRQRQRKHRIQH